MVLFAWESLTDHKIKERALKLIQTSNTVQDQIQFTAGAALIQLGYILSNYKYGCFHNCLLIHRFWSRLIHFRIRPLITFAHLHFLSKSRPPHPRGRGLRFVSVCFPCSFPPCENQSRKRAKKNLRINEINASGFFDLTLCDLVFRSKILI